MKCSFCEMYNAMLEDSARDKKDVFCIRVTCAMVRQTVRPNGIVCGKTTGYGYKLRYCPPVRLPAAGAGPGKISVRRVEKT